MHLKYINSCRICNNPVLRPAFSFGKHFLHGSFVNPAKGIYPPTRKIPVELVRCDPHYNNGCGLLQLKHTVPPSILYSDYGYRSSGNTTMRNWLKYVVSSVLKIKPEIQAVQDIGANDLFTLKQFSKNIDRIGVDGCDIIKRVDADGIKVINELYPPKFKCFELKFDIILSLACLYDIELINEFVSNIEYQLHKDGIWVFEVAYLPTILKRVDYSHYVQEHLESYSLSVIETLLKRHNFKLFKCELSETNGGSILCFACKDSCHTFANDEDNKNLQKLRLAEFEMELDMDKPYIEFADKMNEHGRDLYQLITKIVNVEKKTVYLYSASTKGNLVLQKAGLDNKLIKYAAERSPEKFGCKTLGTNIEIISEEDSRNMKPDYYLCLIPAFKNEVLEREKEFINNGGKFIFPFPAPITILP